MSGMHFTELNSTYMASCCTGCDLDPPRSLTHARSVSKEVIKARTPVCTGDHYPVQPHHFPHQPAVTAPLKPRLTPHPPAGAASLATPPRLASLLLCPRFVCRAHPHYTLRVRVMGRRLLLFYWVVLMTRVWWLVTRVTRAGRVLIRCLSYIDTHPP